MIREAFDTLNLPDEPGIYQFRKGRKILYVGKATSLRDRVRSYFARDLIETRGPRIVAMVDAATTITWITTDSVLEALILEASLIKQYQPQYNVEEKDNKSFNYVVITKEDFPRVLVVRGRELFQKWDAADIKDTFGPFPSGSTLQEALKIVRRIFPFRDNKCVPCGSPKNMKCKPCFNRQIGLCPGTCTGEVTKGEYAQVVAHIRQLFSGNFKGLKRELAREMKSLASGEKFEDASRVRRQIDALTHIKDVSLIKDDSRISSGGSVRIEAFDTAHTGGAETVAVMTVVADGEAQKDAYRKFKIQTVGNNDVAALTEVLSRRLAHDEWQLPRVFVVDGGTAQMNAARKVLKSAGVMVPLVGVVKDEFHRPKNLIGDQQAIKAFEKDILLANSEAHRFAITWHRARLRKTLI